MSATNGTNDLLATVAEAEAEPIRSANARTPQTMALDAEVVATCAAIFGRGKSIIPHRAFATDGEARKAVGGSAGLLAHAKAAAEALPVAEGKRPQTASVKARQFTDAYRAANAWCASATNDQWFAEVRLTYTKGEKTTK